jgi:hypothetical protein
MKKKILVLMCCVVVATTSIFGQAKFGIQAGVGYGRNYFNLLPNQSSRNLLKQLLPQPMIMGSFRYGKGDFKFITELGWERQSIASPRSSLGQEFYQTQQHVIVLRPLLEYRVLPRTGFCIGTYASSAWFKESFTQDVLGTQYSGGAVLAVNQYFKHWFAQFSYQQSLYAKDRTGCEIKKLIINDLVLGKKDIIKLQNYQLTDFQAFMLN